MVGRVEVVGTGRVRGEEGMVGRVEVGGTGRVRG